MPNEGSPQHAPPSPPGRRRARPLRVAGFALAALAALALLLLAGLVLARTWIAERLILEALHRQGLTAVSLSVPRLDTRGLVVTDLTAENGALEVGRIELAFTLREALRRRFERVSVDTGRARVAWTDDAVRLGNWTLDLRPGAEPLALPHIARIDAGGLTLVVEMPTATLTAQLGFSAMAVEDGWDARITAALEGPGAKMAMDWSGVVTPADLAGWSGEGRFALSAAGLNLPGVADGFEADGDVTVAARGGVFTVTLEKPMTLRFTALAAELADAYPLLQGLRPHPVSVTVNASHGEAALVVSAVEGRRGARFDLSVAAQAGRGRATLVAQGETSQAVDAAAAQAAVSPIALAIGALQADMSDFPLGEGVASGRLAVSDVTGTTAQARGRVDAAIDLKALNAGSVVADRLQGSLSGPFETEGGRARVILQNVRAIASGLTMAGWALTAPANLSLASGGRATQTVAFALDGPRGPTLSVDAAFALSDATLRAVDAAEPALATVRLPLIRLAGDADLQTRTLSFAATGASVSHPMADLRDAVLDLRAEGDVLSAKAAARLARLGPAGETPPPAGSALALSAALTPRAGGYVLRGSFASPAGAKLGDFAADVGTGGRRGTASLTMPKADFARGGALDPAFLSFITTASDMTGSVGLTAKVAWDPKGRTESARVTLDGVGFAVGDTRVAGLTTDFTLTGFSPLRAETPQRIAAASIMAGAPLSDLQADISLPGDNTVVLGRGAVGIAGGRITVADAVIPLDDRATSFAVGIDRIDMAQIAALAKVDGLAITGTLSGTIPLRGAVAGMEFAEGLLRADAPGRVVYKPATPPAALAQSQGGNLLLQALSNFAYDRLSITVNGPVTDDITLAVGLAGKNPDLYGGYPIEFNLNLSGRLTQILRQGLVSYGLPADIERQIRDGKAGGP